MIQTTVYHAVMVFDARKHNSEQSGKLPPKIFVLGDMINAHDLKKINVYGFTHIQNNAARVVKK